MPITTLDYALMANRVYNIDSGDSSSWSVGSFDTGQFKEGMNWGATNTDFKGCAYADARLGEVVIALQGTKPSKGGDLLADLQIVIGMLPQYCSAARRLLEATQAAYPGFRVSLVGHSLGGGLAQVLGHWTGLPFVTFNAPGMWGDIQRAKMGFLTSPANAYRSIKGTFKGGLLSKQAASTGRNFRNVLDPVSAYGFHYGPVTRFWGAGLHSMDDVQARIARSRWAKIDPLAPEAREWGEL
jgi:hypothetical protein